MANASERIRWYPGFREMALLCLVILYAPLIIVMIYSFNDSPSITIWKGFSFVWYEEVFFGPEAEKFKQATINSLIIAVLAAIASTLIATASALAMIRGRHFRGQAMTLDLLICL